MRKTALLALATPASAQTTTLSNGRVTLMVVASQQPMPDGATATTSMGVLLMPPLRRPAHRLPGRDAWIVCPAQNIMGNNTGQVVLTLGTTLSTATGGQPIPTSTVANAASVASRNILW